MPETGEAALIHGVVRPAGSILDLGCGPGRIAGPLAALGHAVTGIDNGAAMIAALPDAVEGIVADVETIRLRRRFDAVLLASHFVNDPDHAPAFLETAAAHVRPDGAVIAETYPPGWDPLAGVGRETRHGDAIVVLERATVAGGLIHAEVRYGVDGQEWHQPFVARLFDESDLRALLTAAGLTFDRWLERPGWFIARPPR